MVRDRRSLIVIAALVALVAAIGYTGHRVWTISAAMSGLHNTQFNQFQGPADAPKTIVEFLDYRCSFCRMIHPVIEQVLERNPDVRIIYRHLPVFGRPSVIEAEVALAAGMHGKFLEAHNYLIGKEEPITEREINALATRLGIEPEIFRRDMKDRQMGVLLINTLDTAEALDIGSTPTFVIGDIVYRLEKGVPTPEMFEELLEDAYGP